MEKNITRRKFIKKSIFAGAAITGTAAVGTLAYKLLKKNSIDDLYGEYPPDKKLQKLHITDPHAPKPNIIIIYADDLGYGDVGFNGNTLIRTPHIDQIAHEGVKFTDFYVSNAVCAPSRAGLLTGRYPFRSGVIGNPYPENEPKSKTLARNFGIMLKGLGVLDLRENYVAEGLSSKEITLPEALKLAGYRTAMLGKWHLGDYSKDPAFNPVRHGFDQYLGVPYSNDMSPFPLYKNEKEIIHDIGQDQDQAELTGRYTKEAVKFINGSKGKPFFLYFAHTFPHQPLFASEKFDKKSQAGKYGDAVEEVDWSVGEVLKALRKNGQDKNTLIFFLSDNGPWFEGSAGKLRGRKGQSYEGGFRVPFAAKWPGHIPRGRVVTEPAVNMDLFPTLLSLAGVSLREDRIIDGKNIYGLLTGKDNESPHDALYFYHYDLLEGIRMGKWKYFDKINRYVWPIPLDTASVPNTLGKSQLGNRWPLLYDLSRDPGESYNVINTYPEIAKKLKKTMKEWRKKTKSNPRGFKVR